MIEIIILGAVLPLAVYLWLGAPFVPTKRSDLEQLFKNLPDGNNHVFVDLGAGNGKVLRAAAEANWQAQGYEVNFVLRLIAWWRTRRLENVQVIFGAWQNQSLDNADLIYAFTTSFHGKSTKFKQLITGGRVVISYGVKLGKIEPTQVIGPFIVYGDLNKLK